MKVSHPYPGNPALMLVLSGADQDGLVAFSGPCPRYLPSHGQQKNMQRLGLLRYIGSGAREITDLGRAIIAADSGPAGGGK